MRKRIKSKPLPAGQDASSDAQSTKRHSDGSDQEANKRRTASDPYDVESDFSPEDDEESSRSSAEFDDKDHEDSDVEVKVVKVRNHNLFRKKHASSTSVKTSTRGDELKYASSVQTRQVKNPVLEKSEYTELQQTEAFGKLSELLASLPIKKEMVLQKEYDSPAWKYFRKVVPANADHNQTVVCLLCWITPGKSKKSGRTRPRCLKLLKFEGQSNLTSHLSKIHPSEHQVYQLSARRGKYVPSKSAEFVKLNRELNETKKAGTSGSVRLKQSTLRAFVQDEMAQRNSGVKNLKFANMLLTRLLVERNIAFDVCHDKLFHQFCEQLNSTYVPPNNEKLNKLHKELCLFVICKVQICFKKSKCFFTIEGRGTIAFCTISFDGWTSENGVTYLGIILVIFNVDKCLHEYIVLAVYVLPNRKTAIALGKALGKVLSKNKISQNFVWHSVTDEEGAVTNASKYVANDVSHDGCYNHQLNTTIKHSCSLPERAYKTDHFESGKLFFDNIRAVVKLFTKSPMKLKFLKRIQQDIIDEKEDERLESAKHNKATAQQAGLTVVHKKPVPVGLIKFVVTRWGCAFLVLCRLIRLRPSLVMFFRLYRRTNRKAHPYAISDSTWDEIEEVAALLAPCFVANKKMQGEKYVCRSYSFLFAYDILMDLESSKTETLLYTNPDTKLDYEISITTDLAQTMRDRMIRWFKLKLGTPSRLDLISMTLDPRTRECILHLESGKYKKDAIRAVTAELRKVEEALQPPDAESPGRCTTPPGSPTKSPTKKKRRVWASGAATTKNPLRPGTPEEVVEYYLNMQVPPIPDNDPFNVLESLNPLRWWVEVGETHPTLLVLSRIAIRCLCAPRTSSFCERIFSSAGNATNGLKSGTKPTKLNLTQLIKFNGRLCSEEDWRNLPSELDSSLKELGVSRKDLGFIKAIFLSFSGQDEPTSDDYNSVTVTEACDTDQEDSDSSEASSQLPSDFEAGACCNDCSTPTLLVKAVCSEEEYNSGSLQCDSPSCSERGIGVGDVFWGCPRCDEYDICNVCYNLML